MSTKAIMEALTQAKSIGAPTSRLSRLCAEALREVDVIRAAAKHISEGGGSEALRDSGEDYDVERSLFDAIAQEGT